MFDSLMLSEPPTPANETPRQGQLHTPSCVTPATGRLPPPPPPTTTRKRGQAWRGVSAEQLSIGDEPQQPQLNSTLELDTFLDMQEEGFVAMHKDLRTKRKRKSTRRAMNTREAVCKSPLAEVPLVEEVSPSMPENVPSQCQGADRLRGALLTNVRIVKLRRSSVQFSLGILLQMVKVGDISTLVVAALTPGGVAESTECIHVGDVLVGMNGKQFQTLEELATAASRTKSLDIELGQVVDGIQIVPVFEHEDQVLILETQQEQQEPVELPTLPARSELAGLENSEKQSISDQELHYEQQQPQQEQAPAQPQPETQARAQDEPQSNSLEHMKPQDSEATTRHQVDPLPDATREADKAMGIVPEVNEEQDPVEQQFKIQATGAHTPPLDNAKSSLVEFNGRRAWQGRKLGESAHPGECSACTASETSLFNAKVAEMRFELAKLRIKMDQYRSQVERLRSEQAVKVTTVTMFFVRS